LKNSTQLKAIENVAIYVRKSRGDTEEALSTMRESLQNICKKNGWKHTTYEEVASSSSMDWRNEIQALLLDIERGRFDAVLVDDVDRLARADSIAHARIKTALSENEVLLMDRENVYDYSNPDDTLRYDLKALFAGYEYSIISKRLQRGKMDGAAIGRWTNGKPPYPYVYDRENKRLIVDEAKRNTYNWILKMTLEGWTSLEIAWDLNQKKVPGPSGGIWSSAAIYRIMVDETHMGKIVYGKTMGGQHKQRKVKKFKKIDKEFWIVGQGTHEPLKTEKQHEKILELYTSRKIVPHAARRGAFSLSGLLFCGLCGYRLQFNSDEKTGGDEFVKHCQHHDPIGNKCNCRGIKVEKILVELVQIIEDREKQLESALEEVVQEEYGFLENQIKTKDAEIAQELRALDRIQKQYEDGDISQEECKKRKMIRGNELKRTRNEKTEFIAILEGKKKMSSKEKLDNLRGLRERILSQNVSREEKNRFLRSVFSKIEYVRIDETVELKVYY